MSIALSMPTNINVLILDVNKKNYIDLDKNGYMSIGERIKKLRNAADPRITQKQLAKKVGISQAALSYLETGESEGTVYLASVAHALGVNALWLETGKGDPGANIPIMDEKKEELLHYYEALSPVEVAKLLDYAQDLFKIATYNKQQEAIQNKPEAETELSPIRKIS